MDALGKLYTSTTIVTVNAWGKMNGCAVAWATRVSLEPPMIAVSIGKQRYTHELMSLTDLFGVCIMLPDARKTVSIFGSKTGRYYNKFDGIEYKLSENDVPILPGSLAFIECRTRGKTNAGDHTIFVGEVMHQKVMKDSKPLLYGEGRLL